MAVETRVRSLTTAVFTGARGWLDRLFLPAAPGAGGFGRVALAAGAVLCAAALSLARIPHGFDVVYAEDGSVFLTDALNKTPLDAFVTPYSGYLHLAPRLLVEVVALFPAGVAPVALAVVGALTTSLLALFVYVAAGAHLRTPLLRLAVAFPVALPMVAQAELPNSITMLRWLFMYTTCWALLWVPASRTGRVVATVVVVVAAFSDNVVVLYVPLAAVRVWSRRDAQGAVSLGALLAGAVVNVALVATGTSEHPSIAPRVDPLWAVQAFVLRPVPQAFLGEHWVGMRPTHDLVGLAPVVLAWLLVALAVRFGWRRGSGADRPLAVLAGGYCVAVFLFVAMVSGNATGRYSVPSAFLAITVVAALLRPDPPDDSATAPRPAVVPAAVLLLVLAFATSLRTESPRSHGPRWSVELRSARAICAASHGGQVDVAISPHELGWHARVPCSYVR
jgi:hypothetical protein